MNATFIILLSGRDPRLLRGRADRASAADLRDALLHAEGRGPRRPEPRRPPARLRRAHHARLHAHQEDGPAPQEDAGEHAVLLGWVVLPNLFLKLSVSTIELTRAGVN